MEEENSSSIKMLSLFINFLRFFKGEAAGQGMLQTAINLRSCDVRLLVVGDLNSQVLNVQGCWLLCTNLWQNLICRKVRILSIETLRIVSFYFIKISTMKVFSPLFYFFSICHDYKKEKLISCESQPLGLKILFIGNDNKQLFYDRKRWKTFPICASGLGDLLL